VNKCDGCWTESQDQTGWIYFAFKHLKATWLCIACQPKWQDHMIKLQEAEL